MLDRWVLTAAVRQRCLWSSSGLDMAVAVNVSMRSLEDPTFPEFVRGLVRSHCLGQLTIEVTETGIMKDRAQAIKTLDSLSRLGVHLSIDDFGTGYSSLSYLRELPVGEFKIDRSFVGEMLAKPSDAAVVASVVTLAHNYGRTVVAEGVEDAATLDALAALGCDVAQGYFISKPLRPDAFATWYWASFPASAPMPAMSVASHDHVPLHLVSVPA
jgi:EAL domain-containing protein (putative c-di-GMP-specific phosphodiesterase class I)